MRLLLYIEPTSYVIPLWRAIKDGAAVDTRIVFLEENLSQDWNIDTTHDSSIEVLRGSFSARFAKMTRLLWHRDVRLIALDGWSHPFMLLGLFAAWVRGIPATVGSDTQYEPGKAFWRRALKRLVLPLLFRIPACFFPGGTRQAAYFRRYGVPQSRIRIRQMSVDVRTIMAEVDRDRGGREDVSINISGVRFLYVGRLEPYKGIKDLLEAFMSLNVDARNCQLILVGDGSLRSLVQGAANSDSRVKYLGRLSGSQLIHAYGNADVFILPSHFEPWGLVVNEAMAASLALIVTSRVGCVDDLVRDGVNGGIIPCADPASLAEAMRAFVKDPDAARAMGQASREIISNWTIEDEARIMGEEWNKLS
jgi:glycosyltransferase involved in cell wall biosynthesis